MLNTTWNSISSADQAGPPQERPNSLLADPDLKKTTKWQRRSGWGWATSGAFHTSSLDSCVPLQLSYVTTGRRNKRVRSGRQAGGLPRTGSRCCPGARACSLRWLPIKRTYLVYNINYWSLISRISDILQQSSYIFKYHLLKIFYSPRLIS
jgi:hypothetical protein